MWRSSILNIYYILMIVGPVHIVLLSLIIHLLYRSVLEVWLGNYGGGGVVQTKYLYLYIYIYFIFTLVFFLPIYKINVFYV